MLDQLPEHLRERHKNGLTLPRRAHTFLEQKGVCPYCQGQIPFEDWTLDHKLPRSRGGGGGPNLVGSCKKCNGNKGPLTEQEFLYLKTRSEQKAKIAEIMQIPNAEELKSRRAIHAMILHSVQHFSGLPIKKPVLQETNEFLNMRVKS